MKKPDYLYRYEGIKITDGWKHPVTKTVFKYANWFDSQSEEQLAALNVTRHEWPVIPQYDSYYQKPVEQPSGEYVIEDLPLAEVKAKKKAELNAIRDRKKREGFMHNDVLFQSDENSFFDLEAAHGSALAAKILGVDWSKEWTAADNSKHQLDANGMIALHSSLVMRGQELHDQCQALKATVDSKNCDTGAKVKAVEWPE